MSGKFRMAVQVLGVFLVLSLLVFGIYNFNMILVLGAFLASFAIGRLFCGWFCPMGTWMEYVVARFSRNGQVPGWIQNKIFRGSFFAGFAVFFYWAFTFLPRPYNGFAVMGVMVVFGTGLGLLFAPKTWCAYACPWGTMMSLAGRYRFFTHSVSDCKKCYVCTKQCFKPEMLRAELASMESDGELPRMPDCISCQKCVDSCPKNAIKLAS
jgi:ferredoxin-type protein NapH